MSSITNKESLPTYQIPNEERKKDIQNFVTDIEKLKSSIKSLKEQKTNRNIQAQLSGKCIRLKALKQNLQKLQPTENEIKIAKAALASLKQPPKRKELDFVTQIESSKIETDPQYIKQLIEIEKMRIPPLRKKLEETKKRAHRPIERELDGIQVRLRDLQKRLENLTHPPGSSENTSRSSTKHSSAYFDTDADLYSSSDELQGPINTTPTIYYPPSNTAYPFSYKNGHDFVHNSRNIQPFSTKFDSASLPCAEQEDDSDSDTVYSTSSEITDTINTSPKLYSNLGNRGKFHRPSSSQKVHKPRKYSSFSSAHLNQNIHDSVNNLHGPTSNYSSNKKPLFWRLGILAAGSAIYYFQDTLSEMLRSNETFSNISTKDQEIISIASEPLMSNLFPVINSNPFNIPPLAKALTDSPSGPTLDWTNYASKTVCEIPQVCPIAAEEYGPNLLLSTITEKLSEATETTLASSNVAKGFFESFPEMDTTVKIVACGVLAIGALYAARVASIYAYDYFYPEQKKLTQAETKPLLKPNTIEIQPQTTWQWIISKLWEIRSFIYQFFASNRIRAGR